MGSVQRSWTSPDAITTLRGFRTSRDGLGPAKLDLPRRDHNPKRVPNLPGDLLNHGVSAMCDLVTRARLAFGRGMGPWLCLLSASAMVAVGGAGCRQKSKTPAEAFKRFAAAVNAGDGGALFDA